MVRYFLAAFDHIGKHLKGYRLHLAHCFFVRDAISHNPGKFRDRRKDSPIFFPMEFNPNLLDCNYSPDVMGPPCR
jgi:hypothetical protein